MGVASPPRRRPTLALAVSLLVLPIFAACGGEDPVAPTCATDPSLCPPEENTTAEYLSDLPTWQEFAQPDTVLRNSLDAAGDTLPPDAICDKLAAPGRAAGAIEGIRDVTRAVP